MSDLVCYTVGIGIGVLLKRFGQIRKFINLGRVATENSKHCYTFRTPDGRSE